MPEGLWARADCGVETVRSPEGSARFDNPSVSFADSSLCTREPGAGFTSAAYVKSAKVPTAAWPLWDVDNSVETV